MQILVKGGTQQTFTGADAGQRFARDDAGDDVILRERDLHAKIPVPRRLDNQDEPVSPLPPAEDDDDDKEYGRDNQSETRPKALDFGF